MKVAILSIIAKITTMSLIIIITLQAPVTKIILLILTTSEFQQ
jgi:hypothetical protein